MAGIFKLIQVGRCSVQLLTCKSLGSTANYNNFQNIINKVPCRSLASRPIHKRSRKRSSSDQSSGDNLDKFKPRSAYANWNYDAELSAFMKRIQQNVSEDRLRMALTHHSFLHQNDDVNYMDDNDYNTGTGVADFKSVEDVYQSNDRLTILGYNAMRHFVTEYVYVRYPNLKSSHIYDMINFFMNRDGMVNIAHYLGIADLIRSKILLYNPVKTRIISDVFCAIVGAIYMDLGPIEARSFVQDFILVQQYGREFSDIIKIEHPIFMLTAILKMQRMQPLEARLLRESGRATHFPTYVVGAFSGSKLLSEGAGPSIKAAKSAACQEALLNYFQKEFRNAPLPSDHDNYLAEEEIKLDVAKIESSNSI
ncbi:39S ribosomal protein L44, mitochondrial [Trichoplax sp. H2]|nr:39S ribosomal protein L44, mitochondrial [Trichoplax sp. H2]|eukprot:RDD40445.1 39S ribosomal protein L44, mitochondrial [Trichoplax sp. H2]